MALKMACNLIKFVFGDLALVGVGGGDPPLNQRRMVTYSAGNSTRDWGTGIV